MNVMGEAPSFFLLLCLRANELRRCFADEEHNTSEEACSSDRRWVSALASPHGLHLGMFQANTVTQISKYLTYFPLGPLSEVP